MGRQLRMIAPGWEHPKNERGAYIPLLKGTFERDDADWVEGARQWDLGMVQDYSTYPALSWKPRESVSDRSETYADYAGNRPDAADYMPTWAEGEATLFVMYEDTTEGTPISPPFETPEALAHWLADSEASAFADMTATYDQWLATIKRGSAVSLVLSGGVAQSGVSFQ